MEAISDYAVVGDCRSTALVSRAGSVDWLCWPRFDSPSVFGALLDPSAGRWVVRPAGAFRSERRYLEGTNVLATRFETEGGSALLTDLMPVASEDEKRRLLLPEHELLRVIECQSGEVEVEMELAPRPGYGRERLGPLRTGPLGLRLSDGRGLLTLSGDLPLEVEGGSARARVRLRAGESRHLSLTYAAEWPAVVPPPGERSRQSVARSAAYWRRWSSRLRYQGPAREAVVRSALALRLLMYAPSGAVVAAPTSSLPERVGGDLNWDYRFCWLRDAAFTVRALYDLGCGDEAHAFVSWLLHATRLTRPELRVLYDVHGNPPGPERVLGHLSGYRGSRPVREGNGAADQLQLDVYGEVVEATAEFVRRGGSLDRETRGMLCDFGEYVCRHWREPDEGIWEPRSGRRHNTHSRLLCWAALDRLCHLHEQGHLPGAPAAAFAEQREGIRREVEERAWNPRLRSYVARLDGEDLDASLLLLPWYGFEDASSPRMLATYRRIEERLGAGRGLLYRYRTGESPGEGAFGICGFWGAEFLALGGGTAGEARRRLEELCGFANDVGLFAEEIDPATGAALGNFPQGFTHVGLVNAALSLQRRIEGREPHPKAVRARARRERAEATP